MPILVAKGANGIGTPLFVGDAEHVLLHLSSTGTTTATVKFQKSNQKTKPDFSAAQSPTNQWDYVDVVDEEDGAHIAGDTGFGFSGADDNRNLEVNVNGAQWVNAIVSGWSAGLVYLDGTVKSNT